MRAILSILGLGTTLALAAEPPGTFFDPSLPVHATPANVGDVLARGLLLKAGEGEWVVYDADLLRPAAWFHADAAKEPLTLEGMAQASWRVPTKKAGVQWPKPEGASVTLAGPQPGVGKSPADVAHDPRPVFGSDAGRGGLEASGRKFLGYRIAGDVAVLSSECHGVRIQEWYQAQRQADRAWLTRKLSVAPGQELYLTVAAGAAQLDGADGMRAKVNGMSVVSHQPELRFEIQEGRLLARVAASTAERRLALSYAVGEVALPAVATPALPSNSPAKWPQVMRVDLQASSKSGAGWALDTIPLPAANPWARRMRPADLVFLTAERAAVVTFEGDVWMLEIQGAQGSWRRVAGGLNEPMSIANVDGTLQVFTRHGLIRLRDANGDGEFETYDNFCSLMRQTASTRGYPLDMRVNAAGETFCAIGGIATGPKGISAEMPANPDSGALMKISADGKHIEIISRRAREPFFDLDPETGRLAMTEQQGNFVPSSGIFPVVPGAYFGYGDQAPQQLALPLAWIPHEEDNSSASPLWLRKSAFREWEGGILDLSYGNGRLFLVRPGDAWPSTQGAVIPLGIETGLPLLHGRVHPVDGSVWFAGFRIYDSSVAALEGVARMRRTAEPLATAVDAQITAEGVVLKFAAALDPASVKAEAVCAKEWQYKRSATYGSPRLKRDGSPGVEGVATGATLLSKDGKSVFVHIPKLQATMQLQIDHDFAFQGGKPAKGTVYFTVNKPAPAEWQKLGFETPALDPSLAAVREAKAAAAATAEAGKELATRFGCIACHSIDGAIVGHSGPTWKGLAGAKRSFKDGSSIDKADDAYLRESILEPAKHIVTGYELGMGSYQGVLSNTEIDSVILYIKSLK